MSFFSFYIICYDTCCIHNIWVLGVLCLFSLLSVVAHPFLFFSFPRIYMQVPLEVPDPDLVQHTLFGQSSIQCYCFTFCWHVLPFTSIDIQIYVTVVIQLEVVSHRPLWWQRLPVLLLSFPVFVQTDVYLATTRHMWVCVYLWVYLCLYVFIVQSLLSGMLPVDRDGCRRSIQRPMIIHKLIANQSDYFKVKKPHFGN